MIIQETLRHLRDAHGDLLVSERVDRLVVGVHFTAAQLSGGTCGIARSDLSADKCCAAARPRDVGAFSPGRLRGRPVLDILEHSDDRPLFNSVKLAILNALSARVIARSDYTIEAGRDPIEWIDVSAGRVITIVGAFQSYMDRLSAEPCELHVLELDPGAFPERHRRLYVPAGQAAEVLARSDAVIITGSTLVNQTMDDLLGFIRPGAFTAVVGPSSGLIPDALFRKGVSLIGTIRILDPEAMFTVISEAGSGYHLFGTCAEKICLLHG